MSEWSFAHPYLAFVLAVIFMLEIGALLQNAMSMWKKEVPPPVAPPPLNPPTENGPVDVGDKTLN